MSSWREQYDRMKRWRERVSQHVSGEDRETYNLRILDCLHAFFVTCHHLEDWLINDPAHPIPDEEVKDFAHGSEWLGRCADIANGSKHAVLKKARLAGGTVSGDLPIQTERGPVAVLRVEGSYFEIETKGTVYDAKTAVDACINQWDEFLKKRGLLS